MDAKPDLEFLEFAKISSDNFLSSSHFLTWLLHPSAFPLQDWKSYLGAWEGLG